MRGVERESLQERTIPLEELTDEEFGNLLSSLGNHEAKLVTLLQMRPGIIYSREDLWKTVLSAQGERPVWRMDSGVPFGYCRDSLSSIGLVAKEVVNRENLETYGYMITDYGREVGIPFAGYSLDFSKRYPHVSLIDIFGATHSSSQTNELDDQGIAFKKRAPNLRFKIFWELVTSNLPIREVDLANSLGEDQGIIGQHLQALANKGIILYQTTESGSPYAFYQLNPEHPKEEPPAYRSYSTLGRNVYQALQEHQETEWTTESLAKYLRYLHPNHVTSILSHLERKGYAKKGQFGEEYRSEIDLNHDQRAMLSDVVTMLDEFRSQDPYVLQKGRQLALSLTSSDISSLMSKAKEHSSQASAQPPQERASDLLTIISQNPDITSFQIAESYTRVSGMRLSHSTISKHLRELVHEGQIGYEIHKGVRKYTIAPQK